MKSHIGFSRRSLYLITILLIFSGCGQRQQKVEKIIEDGVEVIVNHLEPYQIQGQPRTLHLEEEFTIDTERDDIVQKGLTDISAFDIDSEGNIYFFQIRESDKTLAYKFDKNGNFVAPFGKKGQGPDEIQSPIYLNITGHDEIPIQDYGRFKLFVFDTAGSIIKETHLISKSAGQSVFYPLENGSYAKFRDYTDPVTKHRYDVLELHNSRFEEIKELDRCDYGPVVQFTQQKKKGSPRVFIFEISGGRIYLGNENRGYEILVYGLDGKLLKKIRKEYHPADAPDEFKENLMINMGRFKDQVIVPEKMPPFHYFFLDDEGRLYVKTYEKGNNENEYIHDIFNSEGVFIKRMSLPGFGSWMYPGRELDRAKAKNQRLYCIREKESGYKELAVYKMNWE